MLANIQPCAPGHGPIGGWSTSEAPPLTAEICGSAGVSLQVSAL